MEKQTRVNFARILNDALAKQPRSMSALGHEQTSASRSEMSALPPKADMFSVEIDVCFVPTADILRVEVGRSSEGLLADSRR